MPIRCVHNPRGATRTTIAGKMTRLTGSSLNSEGELQPVLTPVWRLRNDPSVCCLAGPLSPVDSIVFRRDRRRGNRLSTWQGR